MSPEALRHGDFEKIVIPYGYCHCGCGRKTNIPNESDKSKGWIRGVPVKFIWHHNLNNKSHHGWNGGKSVSGDGYMRIRLPNHPNADAKGYVFEHVVICEKALGKFLPRGAIIHHHNKDKKDNKTPGNLVICQDRAYHQLIHQRMRAKAACGHASWRKCWICKQHDDPLNLIFDSKNKTMHRSCENLYQREIYWNKKRGVK